MKSMNKITDTSLNLEAIANSGQCFRWKTVGPFFYSVVDNQVIKIRSTGKKTFYWQTYPRKNNYQLLAWHLSLDKDYDQIVKSINKDRCIAKAIDKYWGLRELRQPLFETVISFIISANNSVPLICRSVEKLCQRWGEKIKVDGHEFYTFPDALTVSKISLKELMKHTRIGFRAKYVKATAQKILSGGVDLNEVRGMNCSEACAALQTLPGVGTKVADCVALFALGHDHRIPFDVWMKKIFVQIYGQPAKAKYSDLQKFANDYFGLYAGWAHQFLYMYCREYGMDALKK